jgi:hypothetical protein
MPVTVELQPDMVDAIIRQELTTYLRICEADVRGLEAKAVAEGGLREWEREDLANFENSIIHLKAVIRLYTAPSEWA